MKIIVKVYIKTIRGGKRYKYAIGKSESSFSFGPTTLAKCMAKVGENGDYIFKLKKHAPHIKVYRWKIHK